MAHATHVQRYISFLPVQGCLNVIVHVNMGQGHDFEIVQGFAAACSGEAFLKPGQILRQRAWNETVGQPTISNFGRKTNRGFATRS